jgi:hypothetical protein
LKNLFVLMAALLALPPGHACADGVATASSPTAQSPLTPALTPSAPAGVSGPLSPSVAAPMPPQAPAPSAPPQGLLDGVTMSPAALTPPAGAAQGVSASPDPLAPEEVSDPLALVTQPLDLASLASPILLKLARALSKGSDKVWFDPELQQALSASTPGAQSAAAEALFAELNRRAGQGDKESKQALDLAVKLHGDLRALSLSPSDQALTPSAQTLSGTAQP